MLHFSYNISFALAGIIVVSIILLIVSIHYSNKVTVNNRYRLFLFSTIAMISLDIITVYTNDNSYKFTPFLNHLFNSLYFFSGALVAIYFFYYCVSVALKDTTKKVRKIYYIVNVSILFLLLILLVLNGFFGFFYYFDASNNYAYTGGPLYLLVNLVSVGFVIEAIVVFITKKKNFNKRQLICTALFFASFFVSFLLQLFVFKKTLLSDFGIALGALIVFFSIETPDYVKLVQTLEELQDLKIHLEEQVSERTNELDKEKQSYQELTMETLQSLALVIDAKDHYTKGHSTRVATYARALALYCGLGRMDAEKIYLAGLIHDVGKVGISELIIAKPGRLTDDEYYIIQNHTVIGGDILKGIKKFKVFEEVARYHHERFDGDGYPSGLKGSDIPFEARIVSICDAYDAMVSDRSYRKALPTAKALDEIRRGSGSQFDPLIADKFLELLSVFDNNLPNHLEELEQL